MSNRYISPVYEQTLDQMRTNSGWHLKFCHLPIEKLSASSGSAVVRAKQATVEYLNRLERIAKNTSLTADAKHSVARKQFVAIEAECKNAAAIMRKNAAADRAAAEDRIAAAFSPDHSKSAIYSEIRSYMRSKSTDSEFASKLPELVSSRKDVAVALQSAPGFLSGIETDERYSGLVIKAYQAHCPEDYAIIDTAIDVVSEASRMEQGLAELRRASFADAVADRAEAYAVDVNAPLVQPSE